MFKTDSEFVFDKSDSLTPKDFIFSAGDEFTMQVLSNNGYALVDIIGASAGTVPISYTVKGSGYASLPLIDSMKITGMSLVQLEKSLTKEYSFYFINPFIKLKVKTKRVILFTGRGVGKVLTLENDRVQLLEVIAAGGGLTGNKAYRVKVIRGDIRNPKVYLFDFSTIESYKNTDFLITSNDIVYVEPALSISDVNAKIIPFITLFTTMVLIYSTIVNSKK